MIREDRIAAAFEAVPEECRSSLEPVLRVLIHDLNGALSAVSMEAFTVGQLANKLAQGATGTRQSASDRERIHQTLIDSAANIGRATQGAAVYLRQVQSIANAAGQRKSEG